MAGTLTISTLSDGTNSTSSTNCIQGSAKAWLNLNGAGVATIRGSYNISSVTRNSTGDYTVNFTTAFTDTNYSVVGSVSYSTTGTGGIWFEVNGTNNQLTTSSKIVARAGGGLYDCAGVYVAYYR